MPLSLAVLLAFSTARDKCVGRTLGTGDTPPSGLNHVDWKGDKLGTRVDVVFSKLVKLPLS